MHSHIALAAREAGEEGIDQWNKDKIYIYIFFFWGKNNNDDNTKETCSS